MLHHWFGGFDHCLEYDSFGDIEGQLHGNFSSFIFKLARLKLAIISAPQKASQNRMDFFFLEPQNLPAHAARSMSQHFQTCSQQIKSTWSVTCSMTAGVFFPPQEARAHAFYRKCTMDYSKLCPRTTSTCTAWEILLWWQHLESEVSIHGVCWVCLEPSDFSLKSHRSCSTSSFSSPGL